MSEPPRSGFPTKLVFGVRVPDLTRTPREHWRAALIPYEPNIRFAASRDLYLSREQRKEAAALVDTLPPPPSRAIRAATRTPPVIPFPGAAPRPPTSRQLNLRIATQDYDALAAASRLLGSKPTQVARMLVNAGVRRVLAEYDVTIDEIRQRGGSAVPSGS